jgi:hypothetical protein
MERRSAKGFSFVGKHGSALYAPRPGIWSKKKATHAIHSDYGFPITLSITKYIHYSMLADPFGKSNQIMYSRTRTFADGSLFSIPTIFWGIGVDPPFYGNSADFKSAFQKFNGR